jgi:hypothetical protein
MYEAIVGTRAYLYHSVRTATGVRHEYWGPKDSFLGPAAQWVFDHEKSTREAERAQRKAVEDAGDAQLGQELDAAVAWARAAVRDALEGAGFRYRWGHWRRAKRGRPPGRRTGANAGSGTPVVRREPGTRGERPPTDG